MGLSIVEKQVNSLQSFIEQICSDFSSYEGSVWYRGQSKADYKLLPSYLRDGCSTVPEKSILSAFKQNAIMLTSKQPNNNFDWMFLMQHYGVPTRLLDWSESPLVALYFALENCKQETSPFDSVVWALKPTELNKNANIKSNDSDPYFIPSFDDELLQSYSIEKLASGPAQVELSPIATIATRNNDRIQAQLGVFTIHHTKKVAIEEIGDSSHVFKYVISKDKKEEILKQLSILGINRFQLFPELSSIKDIMSKRGMI